MFHIIQGYQQFFLKKKRALPRALKGVFYRAVLKKPYLRVAEIATTFICNSDCIMCSCSKIKDMDKEKKRMDVRAYESLGRQLDELGCVSVNVTGGEPLVRKDIEGVIAALNPRNKIVNLITNGINLTRENMHVYASLGIDSIVVSLETSDREENDRIRGHTGHFDIVMRAIDWAHEEKIKFGLSLTLGDFNFDKIYELLEFAKNKSVFLCIAHGGSIGNWAENSAVFLSEAHARTVLDLIKKNKTMKIDFSANLNLKPGCPAIVEKIYITPYGDIMTCAFNPISFGNLNDEPLRVIWRRMIAFHDTYMNRKTLCARTYNREFINTFLEPIKDMPQPVLIHEHPYFKDKDISQWVSSEKK